MVILKEAAIVTVRNSSTRFPDKSIKEIVGKSTATDIVVERAKKTGFPVIIATSTAKSDDVFEKITQQHGVHIFRGSLLNKIKRWYDCFNEYHIENALLIDGDDLSYDYDIGIRAMMQLRTGKFDIIANPDDIVTGFFTYAINFDAIKKLYDIVPSDDANTDVITKFLEKSHIGISTIELKEHERNKKYRLTLDYQEDLDFFRKLYDNVDFLAGGKEIIDYLDANKSVSEINIHKQNDYLKNQDKFNEMVS